MRSGRSAFQFYSTYISIPVLFLDAGILGYVGWSSDHSHWYRVIAILLSYLFLTLGVAIGTGRLKAADQKDA